MNSVFLLIQLLLIILFLFILFWQGLIIIAMRNAVKISKIRVPLFWIIVTVANIIFLVIAALFVLTVSLRMLT